MRKICFAAGIIILISTSVAYSLIIRVPSDFPTIQSGINSSIGWRDTILVSPGVYFENIVISDHSIILASEFILIGDTQTIASTIIDGGDAHSVITIMRDDPDWSVVLKGFTIRNGKADFHYGHDGGGIYCENVYAYIDNNVISNNKSFGTEAHGGGIAVFNASCIITNNQIKYNRAGDGGGIYGFNSYMVITGNLIYGDTAHFSGEDGWGGGGIFIASTSMPNQIWNNLITRNESFMEGGGINISSQSMVGIVNNVFFGNESSTNGGGFDGDGYCILINNIFWDNSPNEIASNSLNLGVRYCDVQGGYPGIQNLDIDPLFRDPAIGDFHLMSQECNDSINSPCIDAGNPYSWDSLLTCSWGLGTIIADMGAFGGADAPPNGIGNDESNIPYNSFILMNYPNPFNPTTTIQYNLPWLSDVNLEIFDILGRKVGTIFDENQAAGHHQVVWDGKNFPSGIYFYRLRAGDFTDTKKMLLIR
jgi:hypothetical protein